MVSSRSSPMGLQRARSKLTNMAPMRIQAMRTPAGPPLRRAGKEKRMFSIGRVRNDVVVARLTLSGSTAGVKRG